MKCSLLFLLFASAAARMAATESRIEYLDLGKGLGFVRNSSESEAIKTIKTLNHPWKPTQPLPVTIAEAGLGEDARIVFSDIYADGGSRVFALKDGSGRYLVFCTSKPKLQAKHDGESVFEEKFVLGATHWKNEGGMVVPRGSKTEALLLKFVDGKVVEAAR